MKWSLVFVLFPCFAWGSQSDQNTRIYHGKDAVQGQFPYQISIKRTDSGNHSCGGSILNSKWILTAAHCVERKESDYFVYSGSILLDSGGSNHRIARIILHENYVGMRLVKNDIALLKLQDEIVISERARPVELETAKLRGEMDAVVTGWGLNSKGNVPNNMQYLNVTTLTTADCETLRDALSPNQICAVAQVKGEGVCDADSGGPLVANDKQIGIVSWGPRPCGNGKPDFYVEVSSFVDWIEEKITS